MCKPSEKNKNILVSTKVVILGSSEIFYRSGETEEENTLLSSVV